MRGSGAGVSGGADSPPTSSDDAQGGLSSSGVGWYGGERELLSLLPSYEMNRSAKGKLPAACHPTQLQPSLQWPLRTRVFLGHSGCCRVDLPTP
jgi:hypothetical protein